MSERLKALCGECLAELSDANDTGICEDCRDLLCEKCGAMTEWVDCYNCDEFGFDGHDCGEDTCCCLHPEDNRRCDICEGKSGWRACPTCQPGAFND